MNEHEKELFKELVQAYQDNQKLVIELSQKISHSLENQEKQLEIIKMDIKDIDDRLEALEDNHKGKQFFWERMGKILAVIVSIAVIGGAITGIVLKIIG